MTNSNHSNRFFFCTLTALVAAGLICLCTAAFLPSVASAQYSSPTSISNPSNPASPLNPANPANPSSCLNPAVDICGVYKNAENGDSGPIPAWFWIVCGALLFACLAFIGWMWWDSRRGISYF